MTPQPEQLEALLSRSGDGDLTIEEQTRLRRLLADDPAAEATARIYARLNAILAGHRRLPQGVDFRAFSHDVAARIAEQTALDASAALDQAIDPEADGGDASTSRAARGLRFNKVAQTLEAVDDLVLEAVGAVPDVDFDAFKARVSSAVRKEAAVHAKVPSGQRWPRVLGWLAPLAAAAALVALVSYRGSVVTPNGGGGTQPLTLAFAVDMPSQAGRVAVAFDESADIEAPMTEVEQSGSAIAIAPPLVAVADTADDAYLY